MKTDQQQKLVYVLFFPVLAVMIASSLIAWKYPEYLAYVYAGLLAIVVLLVAVALRMIRTKAT